MRGRDPYGNPRRTPSFRPFIDNFHPAFAVAPPLLQSGNPGSQPLGQFPHPLQTESSSAYVHTNIHVPKRSFKILLPIWSIRENQWRLDIFVKSPDRKSGHVHHPNDFSVRRVDPHSSPNFGIHRKEGVPHVPQTVASKSLVQPLLKHIWKRNLRCRIKRRIRSGQLGQRRRVACKNWLPLP